MYMNDAFDVFLKWQEWIDRTAEISVTCVVQQTHGLRVCNRHQVIHIFRRLDISAHVVMVGQSDAIGGLQMCTKCVQTLAVGGPQCFVGKTGAFGHRRVDLSLNRSGTFAVHHDLHVVVLQFAHMRLAALNFSGNAVCISLTGRDFCQKPRIPARNTRQTKLVQFGFQARAIFGKLVAQFKADIADFFAFFQSRFQQGLAAQGRQVIIHPADRVNADAYVPSHGLNFFRY